MYSLEDARNAITDGMNFRGLIDPEHSITKDNIVIIGLDELKMGDSKETLVRKALEELIEQSLIIRGCKTNESGNIVITSSDLGAKATYYLRE